MSATLLVASLLLLGKSEASAATFTPLALEPGWTNAPFSTRDASVSMVSGIVHFAGAIEGSAIAGPKVFTLPPAFRPATTVYVSVDLCNAAKGRLIILPSGDVSVEAEGGPPAFPKARCFTSLEGASFAPSPAGFTLLTLLNGWQNTMYNTSQAAVAIEAGSVGDIVRFKGAISDGTSSWLFTLPVGFRPAVNVYVSVDLCSAKKGRLFIEPNGTVSVEVKGGDFPAAQCFTSLDGAWFARNAGGLPLQNSWTSSPYGTGTVAIEDIGGIVYFKGAIAKGSGPVALTLPPGFWPSSDVYIPVDLCGATKGRLVIQGGVVTIQAENVFPDAQCFTSLDGASFATSTSSRIDVHNSHYPIFELHSDRGAGTPGSFAAAAMMGAHGFSSIAIPSSWESMITSGCTMNTPAVSTWPGGCDPDGMARALNAFAGPFWVAYTSPSTNQAAALSATLTALKTYQSPAVVPIYGQADHWVTVTQIIATGSTIHQVKLLDGGPPGLQDSSSNSYLSGLQSWGGVAWTSAYSPVATVSIADPFHDQYVVVYDPPRGRIHPAISATFARAPGVVPAHQHAMSDHLARARVWKALTSAGIDADLEIWNAIRGGVAGTAFEVEAVWPSGAPWSYYLVPIFSTSNTAVAFVQLSADDGSFESIHVPRTPTRFVPVTLASAERRARGRLARGESLTKGFLTWDPRSNLPIAKSPFRPYHEFGIVGATGYAAGMIRVALDDGTVVRTQ